MKGLSNYASKQDIPRVGVCSKKAETNDFDSKIARKHPPSNSVKPTAYPRPVRARPNGYRAFKGRAKRPY
ncbi:hypothetical protein MTR_5g010460 [Medicago truncatula]|uniref:Uncharacterized protein n=1 Tax=Medicago truncatula TaxID=3880 RepID=G7KDD3_MEDTR|nr:hypothetical protein MTR_5g010460 [Medicago truncatula]